VCPCWTSFVPLCAYIVLNMMSAAFLRVMPLLVLLSVRFSYAYRPVVIMHGMNNNENGYAKNVDALKAAYPGIYVLPLAVFDDLSSIITSMDKQMEGVVQAIRSDPHLVNGFNFYGESQGALIARVYVSSVNDPPVHNLVALCGPQAGVGVCPTIEENPWKEWCADFGSDILYGLPDCSFCSYWKGENEQNYLSKSQWLAKVNNDKANTYNATYRNNMLSLNKYMASVALRDEIVNPPQSAWHTFYEWNDDDRTKVVPWNETDGYVHDVLGLKTLHERGDLLLNAFDGPHVTYNMTWWNATVLPMFDN
jgi:palmitoyl-protein thioesterase